MDIILLITAFMVKHYICDYLLQKPYQFMNKGKYGHPGGMLHAGIHGVGTIMILGLLTPLSFGQCWIWAFFESGVHYHIDWAKMNLNNKYKLTPSYEKFWWLLGLDQLLHNLTYIGIIWAITQ